MAVRTRTPTVPTVPVVATIGTPGMATPRPTRILGSDLTRANQVDPVTGRVLRTSSRRRPADSPIVGHAVPRGTAIGLDAPTGTAESGSDAVGSALDAAARQRKRASAGMTLVGPLLSTPAARPVLQVRGLVGA